MKRKTGWSAPRSVCFALFALAFALSGVLLARNMVMAKRETDAFDSLAQLTRSVPAATVSPQSSPAPTAAPGTAVSPTPTPVPEVLPQYRELHVMNPDFYGWITVADTQIDYPVMLTPQEPEYYLHRSFDGSYSFRGVPFVGEGFVSGASNTIIYGHHMDDGSMFAGLMNYEDRSFFTLHPSFTFNTLYEQRQYEVIAAFRSRLGGEFEYYKYSNIKNESEFDEYVAACKAASAYDTGVTAEWGDKLVTLSTCAYHIADGRFVVVAKMSEEQ